MPQYDDPKKLHVNEKLTCRVELDERVFTFDQQIKSLDAKGILIGEPDLGSDSIAIGQSLLVRYYRADSAYQFMTRVLGYEDEGVDILLRLAFPGRITRLQRREDIRIVLDGTVAVSRSDGDSSMLRGYLANISAGGILCSLPQVGFLKDTVGMIGKKVIADLTLTTGDTFKNIPAGIRRIAPDPDRNTHVRVHIAFDWEEGKQKTKLRQIIKRNQ